MLARASKLVLFTWIFAADMGSSRLVASVPHAAAASASKSAEAFLGTPPTRRALPGIVAPRLTRSPLPALFRGEGGQALARDLGRRRRIGLAHLVQGALPVAARLPHPAERRTHVAELDEEAGAREVDVVEARIRDREREPLLARSFRVPSEPVRVAPLRRPGIGLRAAGAHAALAHVEDGVARRELECGRHGRSGALALRHEPHQEPARDLLEAVQALAPRVGVVEARAAEVGARDPGDAGRVLAHPELREARAQLGSIPRMVQEAGRDERDVGPRALDHLQV